MSWQHRLAFGKQAFPTMCLLPPGPETLATGDPLQNPSPPRAEALLQQGSAYPPDLVSSSLSPGGKGTEMKKVKRGVFMNEFIYSFTSISHFPLVPSPEPQAVGHQAGTCCTCSREPHSQQGKQVNAIT